MSEVARARGVHDENPGPAALRRGDAEGLGFCEECEDLRGCASAVSENLPDPELAQRLNFAGPGSSTTTTKGREISDVWTPGDYDSLGTPKRL